MKRPCLLHSFNLVLNKNKLHDLLSHLGQIHACERVNGHRQLGEQPVYLSGHAAALPTENNNLIGPGQRSRHLTSNLWT